MPHKLLGGGPGGISSCIRVKTQSGKKGTEEKADRWKSRHVLSAVFAAGSSVLAGGNIRVEAAITSRRIRDRVFLTETPDAGALGGSAGAGCGRSLLPDGFSGSGASVWIRWRSPRLSAYLHPAFC